jgi:ribosomal protein L19
MKKKGKCQTPYCRNEAKGKHCVTCRVRKHRAADPVKYAYNNIKNRAKQRGLAFTITLEDFRRFCIKTKFIAGKGRSAESYTIDRIYNNVGYHIDNIQVLKKGDNVRKYYLSYDWERKIATVMKPVDFENTNEENYF